MTRSSRRARIRRAAGFTLVEALFAALLLVAAAGSLARGLAAATATGRATADSGLAARIARARLDGLHAARLTAGWLGSGYHDAVAPGGSTDFSAHPTPGYVEYFDAAGLPAGRDAASIQVRWRVEEVARSGSDRLAALRFEVAAGPAHGGAGPVVRLISIRAANRE